MVSKTTYNNRYIVVQPSASEPGCSNPCSTPPVIAAARISKRAAVYLPPAEPLQTEICLSPMLWSDSLGLLVDG